MFYQLPPAGNPITLQKSARDNQTLSELFGSPNVRLYNSGAAALAAALHAVARSRPAIKQAEVLMPAYSCPELVSAVLHAGAKPVLVDLEYQRPWLSLSGVEKKITANTIAIIGVNLFGIPERFQELRKRCQGKRIILIEDSAQYFPSSKGGARWSGDLTILSFGRGKPVSLLGGGAVLYRDRQWDTHLPDFKNLPGQVAIGAQLKFVLKALLYNLLLSPHLYWLPQSLPFLHLGETIFKPLEAINSFPPAGEQYIVGNVAAYWSRARHAQTALKEYFASNNNQLIDLASSCCGDRLPPLVRFPVLAQSGGQAQAVYDALAYAGLGVSRMYRKPLTRIAGLEQICGSQGLFPNAEQFADTLLTLPVYEAIDSHYVSQMHKVLSAISVHG